MNEQIILPLFLSFGITLIAERVLIPFLRRKKAANTERQEGVKSHLKKAGTPTMGGVGILLGILVGTLFFIKDAPVLLPVLLLTFGFGWIGFLDDYLKVFLRRSDGLIAWQKLLLELFVSLLFLFVLVRVTGISLQLLLPFSGGRMIDIGPLGILLAIIVLLATVNGVNFTDGLDGLCSSVTGSIAAFFIGAALLLKSGLTPAAAATAGALLAFLLYNSYPARIFMGDTGSLALGGFVAGAAYVLHMPLYILIFGAIYAAELLSVTMQVLYFKATHGKRIFKMTPIHHHFELSGYSETQIVTAFTVLTILLSALCLAELAGWVLQ